MAERIVGEADIERLLEADAPARDRAPQYFYAFDLLWKDAEDLRGLPLIKRKRLLKKIVKSPWKA